MMKSADHIFSVLAQQYPTPLTELIYNNHFTLTVAVILSAQATDVSVNKATKELFAKYSTPAAILSLQEEGLKKYIRSIGLYNSKAKNIIKLCEILIEKYNSQIPDSFEELINLPGIGRKTANVVLNCAFGKPTIAVDTHVFRVAKRLGLSDGNTPLAIELDLLKNVPEKFLTTAHNLLIFHGRYICRARTPLCQKCSLTQHCQYYQSIN